MRIQILIIITISIIFSCKQVCVAQCPSVEAIMIDACGTESLNEFAIINSGNGFNSNDISVDFAVGNNIFNNANNDINTDNGNLPGGACGLTFGNLANITGCPNLISIGPGFSVPANSIVVLQMSSGSETGLYNFSSLCGLGQCVYVISNSCTRTAGGFTNYNAGGGPRISNFVIDGCPQMVVYDLASIAPGNGSFLLPITNTTGNSGCVVPPSSPAPSPSNPIFTIDNIYCVGKTPDLLPTNSSNGITVTWSTTTISTSAS